MSGLAILGLVFSSWLATAQLKSSFVCDPSSLRLRACTFNVGKTMIIAGSQKMQVMSGRRYEMFDTPTQGIDAQWESVRLVTVGGRGFIEFLIWGQSSPRDGSQGLEWTVYEVDGSHLAEKTHVKVQERKPRGQNDFIRTPLSAYGLSEEGGKVFWFYGTKKKQI